MEKQYEVYNHLVAVPGHIARELLALDFAYIFFESPASAAAHSVRWPDSVLVLPAISQLFQNEPVSAIL